MLSKFSKIIIFFLIISFNFTSIISAQNINLSAFVPKTKSGYLKNVSTISSLGINKFLLNQNKTPQFNYKFVNDGNTKLSVKSTVFIINAITGQTVKTLYSIDIVDPARLNLVKIKMDNSLKGIYKAKIQTSVRAKGFNNEQTSNEMVFFNLSYMELLKSLLLILVTALIIHRLMNINFSHLHQERLPA